MSRETERLEMTLVDVSTGRRQDLFWLDWSRVVDVSTDGRTVLFDESGVAGGADYRVYARRLSDDSTMKLGDGLGLSLSPDGGHALTIGSKDRTRLRLVPLDGGPSAALPATGLEYQWARYFPDGTRLLVLGNEPERPLRLYVQTVSDGRVVPLTPPAVVRHAAISGDGLRVAVLLPDGQLQVYRVDAPAAPVVVSTGEPLAPLLWSGVEEIVVQQLGAYTQIPSRLARLDLRTGTLQPWREIEPRDTAGVNAITKVMVAPDQRTIVFNSRRVLSELFVVGPPRR